MASNQDASLPHNPDAERATLGAILLDPSKFPSVQLKLTPKHFYSRPNRTVYESLSNLAENQIAMDLTTLAEDLRARGELENAGGIEYLVTLEENVVTTENLEDYANTLLDLARRRDLIIAAEKIREEAQTSPSSVGEILDRSEKAIFDLTQGQESRDFIKVEKVALDAMNDIHKRFSDDREVSGLPTGYRWLDMKLSGMQNSDLIVLAARPSMGKTAFALNVVQHVVLQEQKPAGVFSLEMSNVQIVQRLLCGMARVSLQRVRSGKCSRQEIELLDEHARRLYHAPLYIDDTPGITAIELRAKARRLKAEVPDLSLIVVDYLQLMRGSDSGASRQEQVADMARSLKALARELDLPLMALSRLSRGIEQRKGKDKEPKLSDLRESGAIEQDDAVVMFVHRDRTPDDDAGPPAAGGKMKIESAEIIIGKQRNGPIGKVDLLFIGDITRFETPHPDSGF